MFYSWLPEQEHMTFTVNNPKSHTLSIQTGLTVLLLSVCMVFYFKFLFHNDSWEFLLRVPNVWGCVRMEVKGNRSVCQLPRNPFFSTHTKFCFVVVGFGPAVCFQHDLFVWVPFTRWTAADLRTAYCVHTHKPISTLQDKQQMRILLPLLSKSTPGLIRTAAHETDGRSARGRLCSCGQCAVQLRAFSTLAVLTQLRHRRLEVCHSIHRWDPRVQLVCILEHVPLRQSIKCNLCPVTPEELKQPQGVVSTWPCEFQISLFWLHRTFSHGQFSNLSPLADISQELCALWTTGERPIYDT